MKKTEQTQALQRKVRAALEDPAAKLSQKKLASQIGRSGGMISAWLNSKYTGDVHALETALAKWLENQEAREDLLKGIGTEPDWIPTPTAIEIKETLEFAYLMGMQTIVYGSPGMSKTKTCRVFAAENRNVWMLTPTTISGTKRGILQLLSDALNVPKGLTLDMQEGCIDKLMNTRGLLIVDEAQQLSTVCLDLLRQIAEAAEVGLAIVGNEGVYAQMTGGRRDERFAQITSRLTRKVHIEIPEPDDVRAICGAMGVKDDPTFAYLFNLSQSPGALRSVVKVLQLAQIAATGAASEITLPIVKEAYRKYSGVKRTR